MSLFALLFVGGRYSSPTWFTLDVPVVALAATLLPIAAAFELFDGCRWSAAASCAAWGTRPAAVFNRSATTYWGFRSPPGSGAEAGVGRHLVGTLSVAVVAGRRSPGWPAWAGTNLSPALVPATAEQEGAVYLAVRGAPIAAMVFMTGCCCERRASSCTSALDDDQRAYGGGCSISASAICAVIRSCSCGRRAKTSVPGAGELREPTTRRREGR